ncbi:MAG: amidohydrolase [archaeon]
MRLTASLILLNGNFLMTSSKRSKLAMAVRHGIIDAMGSAEEMLSLAGEETRIIDLKGKTVIPGFNDAHTHFLSMGVWLSQVDLNEARSIKEIVNHVAERAGKTPKGGWILGHGWDEYKFTDTKRYPTRIDLDMASKNHPILIIRVCGHMAAANSLALQISKPSGEIKGVDTDPQTGELTGLLFEGAAMKAVYDQEPTFDEMKGGLRLAMKEAHRLGVTSVTDFVTPQMASVYQDMHQNDELKIRVGLSLRGSDSSHTGYSVEVIEGSGIHTNFGDETIKITAVKLAIDGSLGAHTALLENPYSDDPGNHGTLIDKIEIIEDFARRAHNAGFQVAIHAIGDRAVDHAIATIEKTLKATPRKDHRHRIEHCELTNDEQLGKIKKLGIVASMQPNFIGVWGRKGGMYETRLGKERLARCNMYRRIWDEHIPMCFGSDGMPFDPLLGIWSAVTHPIEESRLTVEEAINCYTLGSASASFDEVIKGTLEVGKLADMAVLSDNPLTIDPEKIKDTVIDMTIFDGEIVYERNP